MLDIAELSLLGEGYELRRFNDPVAACAALRKGEEKPALLLTDFAMDTMDGLELSQQCKAACPGLKILMVSGTITEEIARSGAVQPDQFLAKPYKPQVLASTVRALVAEPNHL